MRIYYEPLVPWIWIGCLIMVFGGGVSLSDRRFRIGAPTRRGRSGLSQRGRLETHEQTPGGKAAVRRTSTLAPPALFFLPPARSSRDRRAISSGASIRSATRARFAPTWSTSPCRPSSSRRSRAPACRISTSWRPDLDGEVTLVNFFASWCVPCRAEHPILTDLVESHGVRLFGVSHRDKPADAARFLRELGNPYQRIGADPAAARWSGASTVCPRPS